MCIGFDLVSRAGRFKPDRIASNRIEKCVTDVELSYIPSYFQDRGAHRRRFAPRNDERLIGQLHHRLTSVGENDAARLTPALQERDHRTAQVGHEAIEPGRIMNNVGPIEGWAKHRGL